MKRNVLLVLFWLIPLSLMALIFYFSSQTAEESTEVSRGLGATLLQLYVWLFPRLGLPVAHGISAESIDFFVRKTAHFVIYAALGGSLYHAVRFGSFPKRLPKTLSLFWCIFYSVSDEFHQWFVSGRSGQLRDIAIDTVGAVLGIFLIQSIWRATQKRRAK